MLSARQRALGAIKVGDIIYGLSGGGNGKLLLVYQADETSFRARHVTSQSWAEFGRDGKSRPIPTGGTCTIVSTAALPPEEYDVAIGLDHKMRTAKEYPDAVLTKAEIQLILHHDEFFMAHLLPDE
jgi:hypothetical protein